MIRAANKLKHMKLHWYLKRFSKHWQFSNEKSVKENIAAKLPACFLAFVLEQTTTYLNIASKI